MRDFKIYLILIYIHIHLWTVSESAPPVINNVVTSTTLLETTTTAELVFTLDVTDADGDGITCDFDNGGGVATSRFSVQIIIGTTNWGIYTVPNAGFDFNSQPIYSFDIKCTSNGGTDTETFTVNLIENQAPSITNLPLAGSITVPVATSGIGYNVFTVTATDTENDQITYTITCSPVSPACPFQIFASGDILLDSDISDISITGYDVTVDVSDNYGNDGVPQTFTVQFSGLNNQPSISNLGTTFTVPENSALSSTLETTTCTDADAGDTLSFSMTCTPAIGLTYFNIDSASGVISTSSSSINYEYLDSISATSFPCTVTCSDGDASGTASVTFNVINVNEPPSFSQNAYTITADEGAVGTALQSTAYVIIDEDNTDTKTFSINCGSDTGYFSIDTGSGILSYGSDYDVDAGVRPTSVSCIVTVTDGGGLTDSASLAITINNINDNSPIFSPSTYIWFISDGTAIGTTVGQVTATDADVGTFGNISFSLDQSALGTAYFGIDQNGFVIVQNSVASLGSGATVTFDALATDGGGTVTRVSPTVVTVATTTTSTTTTTDRFKTFFDDERNIAWVTACGIIVLISAILIVWMCCTYLCQNIANKRPSMRRFNFKCCECLRVSDHSVRKPVPEVVIHDKPPEIKNKPKPDPDVFDFWTASGDL